MQTLCRISALFICGVLAALTALLALPGLFGVHPLIIKGGSMAPVYPEGSMIYVRQEEDMQLQQGDAVTFYLEDGETLVTHRVIYINIEEKEIRTKGDANPAEDGIVTPFSRILGKPVLCIPALGYAADFLAGPLGKAGILLAVAAVCVLSWAEEVLGRFGKEAGGDRAE